MILLVRELNRKVSKKWHYFLTRVLNIHYVRPKEFQHNISKFLDKNSKSKIVFISIAPPGQYLINSIFKVREDIDVYNNILKSFPSDYIYPYKDNVNTFNLLLEEGHHLTKAGHILVLNEVVEYTKSVIN